MKAGKFEKLCNVTSIPVLMLSTDTLLFGALTCRKWYIQMSLWLVALLSVQLCCHHMVKASRN